MIDSHFAEAIVAGTSDAVFVKDTEGRYLLVNEAAAAFIGRPKDEILGRTDREWFSGDGLQVLFERDQRVMRNGHWETEEETLISDGIVRTYSSTKGPLRSKDGQVIGLIGISRDVTDQKRTTRRLALYADQLKESNAALERFAHVVSHDLKEPLRSLVMNVARSRQRTESSGLREAALDLARAEAAGHRMNGLIDAVLKDAMLAQRREPLNSCDTNDVVRQVLRDLHPSIEESRATISCGPLPTVRGDEVQLTQLMQNLLLNAVRHSGREEPKIFIRAEPEEGQWRFSVEDDGAGIPDDATERVFLPFERIYRRGQQNSSGSGIGLATCKRIVERHGGRIGVARSGHGGAAFHFTLPAA